MRKEAKSVSTFSHVIKTAPANCRCAVLRDATRYHDVPYYTMICSAESSAKVFGQWQRDNSQAKFVPCQGRLRVRLSSVGIEQIQGTLHSQRCAGPVIQPVRQGMQDRQKGDETIDYRTYK